MGGAPAHEGPSVSRPVSRILSWTVIHLPRRRRATGRACGPAAYLGLGGQRHRPCLALHRVGFAWPTCHHAAGALLPHLFTLAGDGNALACRRSRLPRGSCRRLGGLSLWHFPAGFPGSVSRPPRPAVSGLSSNAGFLSGARDCLAGAIHGTTAFAGRQPRLESRQAPRARPGRCRARAFRGPRFMASALRGYLRGVVPGALPVLS